MTGIQLNTTGSPITVVAFAVVLVVAGAFLAFWGYGTYQDQQAALDEAVEVDATVVDTDIQRQRATGLSDDETPTDEFEYRLTVTFEYEYSGETYRSSNIDLGSSWQTYDTRSDAERAADEYAEGSQVTAHLHPDEPGEAFLEHRIPLSTYLFTGFGVFLVLGAFWMVGMFTLKRLVR